jgi:hypothetical protein
MKSKKERLQAKGTSSKANKGKWGKNTVMCQKPY